MNQSVSGQIGEIENDGNLFFRACKAFIQGLRKAATLPLFVVSTVIMLLFLLGKFLGYAAAAPMQFIKLLASSCFPQAEVEAIAGEAETVVETLKKRRAATLTKKNTLSEGLHGFGLRRRAKQRSKKKRSENDNEIAKGLLEQLEGRLAADDLAEEKKQRSEIKKRRTIHAGADWHEREVEKGLKKAKEAKVRELERRSRRLAANDLAKKVTMNAITRGARKLPGGQKPEKENIIETILQFVFSVIQQVISAVISVPIHLLDQISKCFGVFSTSVRSMLSSPHESSTVVEKSPYESSTVVEKRTELAERKRQFAQRKRQRAERQEQMEQEAERQRQKQLEQLKQEAQLAKRQQAKQAKRRVNKLKLDGGKFAPSGRSARKAKANAETLHWSATGGGMNPADLLSIDPALATTKEGIAFITGTTALITWFTWRASQDKKWRIASIADAASQTCTSMPQELRKCMQEVTDAQDLGDVEQAKLSILRLLHQYKKSLRTNRFAAKLYYLPDLPDSPKLPYVVWKKGPRHYDQKSTHVYIEDVLDIKVKKLFRQYDGGQFVADISNISSLFVDDFDEQFEAPVGAKFMFELPTSDEDVKTATRLMEGDALTPLAKVMCHNVYQTQSYLDVAASSAYKTAQDMWNSRTRKNRKSSKPAEASTPRKKPRTFGDKQKKGTAGSM